MHPLSETSEETSAAEAGTGSTLVGTSGLATASELAIGIGDAWVPAMSEVEHKPHVLRSQGIKNTHRQGQQKREQNGSSLWILSVGEGIKLRYQVGLRNANV